MGSKLLRKIIVFCPFCETEHEVEEREKIGVMTFPDGLKVGYEQRYYKCNNKDDFDCEFTDAEMAKEWLERSKDAHKKFIKERARCEYWGCDN